MPRSVLTDQNGNSITWLDATIKAMEKLGHPAKIEEIFDAMCEYVIDTVPETAKTPTQTIYNQIYTHSHDSAAGQGHEHLFYATSETGVWELVNNNLSGLQVGMSDDDVAFPEGKAILEKHLYRERNRTLVKLAKERFATTHNGRLYCEACGFDFENAYGEIGKGFIEAHHLKPVSEMQEGETTSLNDLVMLCANCHRMIHRIRPWISDKRDLSRILRPTVE